METDFEIIYRILFPDNRVKQIREIGKPYKDESGNRINARIHTGCNKGKETELNLSNSNKLLDESQSIAKIGSWKIDLTTHDLTWSVDIIKFFARITS
jgi:hypothetical protein